MVISQKCHSRIQSLKLTRNFRGGAQSFVTQLQNAFLDLEYCTGTTKNDLEKKTTLLLAIEDSSYHALRDNLAMDSTKDYLSSLAALDQHATMFMHREKSGNRRLNKAERDKRNPGKGGGRPDKGKTTRPPPKNPPNPPTQHDERPLPGIESSVWDGLPREVQRHIVEHNKRIRGKNPKKRGECPGCPNADCLRTEETTM